MGQYCTVALPGTAAYYYSYIKQTNRHIRKHLELLLLQECLTSKGGSHALSATTTTTKSIT
jgi:hypothetical protein